MSTNSNETLPLLARQPSSIIGLDNAQRDAIPISMIRDGDQKCVLSVYGDSQWRLAPFIKNANKNESMKTIDWSLIPPSFVPGMKAIVYRYWQVGNLGIPPQATTVIGYFRGLRPFLNWLYQRSVTRLQDVRPLHCMAYVQDCRTRGLKPARQLGLFLPIEILYNFRAHSPDALTMHPWLESSANHLAGLTGSKGWREPKTLIIPTPILQILFQKAETLLDVGEKLLAERERGEQNWRHETTLNRMRTACYFLLGITTGCRNHELASIELGAGHTTTHDGNIYYWLKGVSLKTYAGPCEWMMPEIGLRCVQLMERWSAPARARIEAELAALGRELQTLGPETAARRRALERREMLHANRRRLFLRCASTNKEIGTLSENGWRTQFKAFTLFCGVDWNLSSHQLRRTFAANAAHHALGDLFYLRHHYKHWTLDMTALYAVNRQQEEELFDEVVEAMRDRKVKVIETWLDDASPITGGGARQINAFREKRDLTQLDSRRALAESTADKVMIRGTGHGWCLATDHGCGGQGLYERTRCIDCKNAVIDSSHLPVWQGIYWQQVELLEIAQECGPGGQARIRRDLDGAGRVLKDLGVDVSLPAVPYAPTNNAE